MSKENSTKSIRFEPNSEKFMDYAIENHIFPGISSYTALVNHALGELQKSKNIKLEVES